MMSWTSATLVPIGVAALAAIAVAVAGGLATQLGPWYHQLAKPTWQPPDWLFGPVWTVVFALTALSGARAWWGIPPGTDRQIVIVLFAVNGLLNVLWSVLFFTLRRPDWALIEVAFLWLSILALIVTIGRYSPMGAWLLAPYLVWVSFASVLNWTIVRLNGPF
jgi:translocator protein